MNAKFFACILLAVALVGIGAARWMYPEENGFSIMRCTISFLGSPDADRNPAGWRWYQLGMTALRAEQAALVDTVAGLRSDRDELASRLDDALSLVADTRSTARGTIVNLPDILFDVNQSTLKPEAKLVIAKLAGILLIMGDLNTRIEGHTDSTGGYDHNMQLSRARASAVRDFLFEQGIAAKRMVVEGYGPDRPIASNDSRDGRAKNRRVEIVIAEGEIAEGDGTD